MLKTIILFIILYPFVSFAADDEISNEVIAKEIEKSFIFNDFSKKQADVHSNKKSSLQIKSKTDKSNFSEDEIKIVVVDPKISNSDVRKKELLAYNLVLVEQYEAAIELYKQVIKVEPNNSYAQFSLATTYQKMAQYNQAKVIYNNMLKNDPQNRQEIIDNLLAILIEETPREAVYLLSRLSAENPNSAEILAKLSNAYYKTKNYKLAAASLKRATELDSKRLEYRYNLAIIYDKMEEKELAIEMYRGVIKDYGDDDSLPIEQIQNRIDSISSSL